MTIGSSDFLVHNHLCNNQESTTAYGSDPTRLNGIQFDQILPSVWLNKVWYQCSIMAAGIGQMMSDKGFNISDGSADPPNALVNLQEVLANILTIADIPGVPWQTFYTQCQLTPLTVTPTGSYAHLMGSSSYSIPPAASRIVRFLNKGTLQNIGPSPLIQFNTIINSTQIGFAGFTPGNNDVWDWEYEVLIAYQGSDNLWYAFPRLTAVDRSTGVSTIRMQEVQFSFSGPIGPGGVYCEVAALTGSTSGTVSQTLQVVTTEN